MNIRLPNGAIYRNAPDGFTQEDLAESLEARGFDLVKLGLRPAEPTPEDQSVFRQIADLPLLFGKGVGTSVRSISDVFGANNAVSKNIQGVEDYLASLLSAQSKNDSKEVSRIMQEAEDQGFGAQMAAGLRAFAVAPFDLTANALGTAATAIAGGLAGGALKGLSIASKVIPATRLAAQADFGRKVAVGVGAVTGAGTVKGSIYSAVKQELSNPELGLSEEEIEKRSQEAQAYNGVNLPNIILGTGFGAAASGSGIENLISKRILGKIAGTGSAKKTVRSALFSGVKEGIPEFVQAGHEQYAANVALQNEGFDVPTMRGVGVSAALEGALGFGLGAGIDVGLSERENEDYKAAYKDITDETERGREVQFRRNERGASERYERSIREDQVRREQGTSSEVDMDAESAARRAQALNIEEPSQQEVDDLAFPMRGDRLRLNVKPESQAEEDSRSARVRGRAYGQKVASTLGDYFPNAETFEVGDGPRTKDAKGNTQVSFIVKDSKGVQYGKPLSTYQKAAHFQLGLANEVTNQNVRGMVTNAIETSGQNYDEETKKSLFSYGYRLLHPDATTYTSLAVNQAAGTIGPGYATSLRFDQIEALPMEKGRYVMTKPDKNGNPRKTYITGLTKAQEINKARAEAGKNPTDIFSLDEARQGLGAKFGNVVTNVDGAPDLPAVPSGALRHVHFRPFIEELLKSKNITSGLESREMVSVIKAATGETSLKDLNVSETRLFINRIASMPKLEQPTKLPSFEPTPYNREHFARASSFIQQVNAQGVTATTDEIIQAAGFAKSDPRVKGKVRALLAHLKEQGVDNVAQGLLRLTGPKTNDSDLQKLKSSLKQILKGYGLNDIKLALDRYLINPKSRETAPDGAKGFFITELRTVFLAIDRIDADNTLTPEQRLSALADLLNHEVVHALRALDLWTEAEWHVLEKTVGRLQRPGFGKTYLKDAQERYADRSPVVQFEEAIAELFRDYASGALKISGQPKALLQRIVEFFTRLKAALTGTQFPNYEEVLNRVMSGEIGSRQRGEIRTLRGTEELDAKVRTVDGNLVPGVIPERLWDIMEAADPDLGQNPDFGNERDKNSKKSLGDFELNDKEQQDAALREVRAYHGSASEFPKFLTTHINTGEGAQAYGWGLYFASSKDVAEWYRDRLTKRYRDRLTKKLTRKQSDKNLFLSYKGRPLSNLRYSEKPEDTPETFAVMGDIYDDLFPNLPEKDRAREVAETTMFLHKSSGVVSGKDSAVYYFTGMLHSINEFMDENPTNTFSRLPNYAEQYQRALQALDQIKSEAPKGSLYEVEIPDDGDYLLWDKPLTEQPESVKRAIKDADLFDFEKGTWGKGLVPIGGYMGRRDKQHHDWKQEDLQRWGFYTGETLYKKLVSRKLGLVNALYQTAFFPITAGPIKAAEKAASLALLELGVPGIKYLDGSSRRAGNGSHNYVIFNESDVSIVSGMREAPVASDIREARAQTPPLGIRVAKDGGVFVAGEPDVIRAAIPTDVRGRVVAGGMQFTSSDSGRVRAALSGEAVAYSRSGRVLAKKPIKDGKYVGAPPKFESPGRLLQLRKMLTKLTREGEPGRYWYENSSAEILRMVGGDVQEARRLVALLAIYSPQAKVDSNTTVALRAWAQYKAGAPISVKTGVQDRKATQAMSDVDAFWRGEKTGNFFNNLLRMIDPSVADKQGATIDMWMMRAAQYPTDAPTKTQYAFMEDEINRIAAEFGWEPQQVQAAIWVAMKARMENKGVAKRTEALSEKKGWIRFDSRKGKKTRVILDEQKHRDNWFKHAFEHEPTTLDTSTAKFDFSDGVLRHIGQMSWQARPGRTTGLLPGVHTASWEQQTELQAAMQDAFLFDGVDLLAQKLGLLKDSSVMVPRVRQREVSPSTQVRIAMSQTAGKDPHTGVDTPQALTLDAYASIVGALLRQEGVGWHRPFYAQAKKNSNGAEISIGRPLSPSEALAVEGRVDEWMQANGHEGWEDSFALISTPIGIRLVNFGVISNAELLGPVADAATNDLPDSTKRWFASDGNMPTNNWVEHPDGQEYMVRASASGRPDVLRWVRDVLAPRIQSVFEEFSNKYGWGDPGDVTTVAWPQDSRNAGPSGALEDIPVPQKRRTSEQLNEAVSKARAEAAALPPSSIPLYNVNASPDALYVSQHPEEGAKLDASDRIRYARSNSPTYGPRAGEAIRRLASAPPSITPTQTLIEGMRMTPKQMKTRDLIDKNRQKYIHNYSRLEWYSKNHPSFMHMTAGTKAIVAAEMADRNKAISAFSMTHGVPVYRDGGFVVDPFKHKGVDVKHGLLGVMSALYKNPYGKSLEELAQSYAIAKRSDRLLASGKKVPTHPGDLKAIQEEVNKYINPETKRPIVEEWYEMYQAYNSNVIKFLKDTGVIDDEGAKMWTEMADYYPFYRIEEGATDPASVKIFGGLTAAQGFKKLKGGESSLNVPLLEAITLNLDAAIAMGMKNVAQQRIVRDMVNIKMGKIVNPKDVGSNVDTVTFKVNGKKVMARIDDHLIYESMQAVPEFLNMESMLAKLFTLPAKALREMITRAPDYMLMNMARDTIAAPIVTGSNMIPVIDTIKNLRFDLSDLQKYGVVGGYDFARDPTDMVKYMAKEGRKLGLEMPARNYTNWEKFAQTRLMKPFGRIWDGLGHLSDASEASTRRAVYEDTMKRTGDWVQASYDALSVINYGRRGRHPGLRILTAVVPFMNARIQGLDKLYQGATGQSGNALDRGKNFVKFAVRAGLMVGLTAAYYAMLEDDDRYNNETEDIRDNYYMFPIRRANYAKGDPGQYITVAIPFEVGVLFKVIPERILRLMDNKDMMKDFAKSMFRATSSTLTMNPIPQAVLPLFENAINYDFYTSRPIVPFFAEELEPIAQSRFTTNEVAKVIGETVGYSPLKLDHLMGGYLGSLGTYAMTAIDSVMRGEGRELPEKKWDDYPGVKRFFSSAAKSGLQEDFYELRNDLYGIVRSVNALKKEGRFDEAQVIMTQHSNILALKGNINAIDRYMEKVRNRRSAIQRLNIDAGDKADMIDQLDTQTAMSLRLVTELRKSAYQGMKAG